ncbi:hypothetical protein EON73_01210 [bacterium]|nr:MAG: hypothetical protein EON73_01210 [bacterium]
MPSYGAIYPTYTDSYTCCYKFTNPTIPTYAAPVTGTNDFVVNTGNPIITYTGAALTNAAQGDGTLFYETGNNVYTTIYTDSNGATKSPISTYYATSTNMWQRTLQSSDSKLTNTLTGKRGMLWFTANNGAYSCIRFNFTGVSNTQTPVVQAVAVGFNGSVTNCGTTTTTTYLRNTTNPTSVATPNVTISYNASTNKMDVAVTAWYIPQYATYSIRFSGFDVNTDDINKTGTCENRISASYSGVSFTNWWTHSANAILNGALGTVNTLGYGPAGGWNLAMVDCSRVMWTRSLTMSQLRDCKNTSNGQEITVTDNSNSGGIIVYSGSLFVQLVAPIFTGYGSGNKAGYTSSQWQFPFNFTFQSSTSATTLVSSGGSYFTVTLQSFSIIQSGPDQGKMYVSLQTSLYAPYGYAANNSLIDTTGTNLVPSGSPSTAIQTSPAVQTFTWISPTVQNVYDGTYTFQWITYTCPGPSNASACVPNSVFNFKTLIYLRAQATSSAKITLNSIITIYNDNTFTIPQSSTFTEGYPICFKDSLIVNLADINVFKASINNAYLCGPMTSDGTLFYDGITNFGCKNSTSVVQLVVNGSVLAGSIGPSTVGYYNPVIYNMPNSIDTGLCINAQARIMDNKGNFYDGSLQYIHMELIVSILGQNVIRNSVYRYINPIPHEVVGGVNAPMDSSEHSHSDSLNPSDSDEESTTPSLDSGSSSRQGSSATNNFYVKKEKSNVYPTSAPTVVPHHHHNYHNITCNDTKLNSTEYCQYWFTENYYSLCHFSTYSFSIIFIIAFIAGFATREILRKDSSNIYTGKRSSCPHPYWYCCAGGLPDAKAN